MYQALMAVERRDFFETLKVVIYNKKNLSLSLSAIFSSRKKSAQKKSPTADFKPKQRSENVFLISPFAALTFLLDSFLMRECAIFFSSLLRRWLSERLVFIGRKMQAREEIKVRINILDGTKLLSDLLSDDDEARLMPDWSTPSNVLRVSRRALLFPFNSLSRIEFQLG